MAQAITETRRRRELQEAWNKDHGITPETILKEIRAGIEAEAASRSVAFTAVGRSGEADRRAVEVLEQLEADMMQAAAELEFEKAAAIRDQINALKQGGSPGGGGRGRGRSRADAAGRRPSGGQGRIPRPKR
jgi:excinuclease ABC subunit B